MLDLIYDNLIADGAIWSLLKGLGVTLEISVLAILLGTGLGALVCWARICRYPALRFIARIYISLLRGCPVLMLLLMMYYVILASVTWDAELVAVVTFALNVSAYIAELMRAALEATDPGQVDAARTLGLSRWQAFRLITLPQAYHIASPVYESTIINLIQWTSVVGYVTITDLTRVINTFSARTMQPVLMISVGMILYILIAWLVKGIFWLLARRGRRPDHE